MKKLIITILTITAILTALLCNADSSLWLYLSDGDVRELDTANIDSISVIGKEKITVTPKSKDIEYAGGTFNINVSSNIFWSVSSNQQWATVSPTSGNGDYQVTVTVQENKKITADNAVLTFKTIPDGAVATVNINRAEKNNEDVNCQHGKNFKIVTIGTQVWMAENVSCIHYDTESEAYKAGIYEIPESSATTYSPYYYNIKDRSKWETTEYAGKLIESQIEQFGLLYNWTAAMGFASENEAFAQEGEYDGIRQGICPNGWHIPSYDEWQTLYNFIYTDKKLSENLAGKYLKTTSGWYDGGNGTDAYGFCGIPSGYGFGSEVGARTILWTTRTYEEDNTFAKNKSLLYNYDYLKTGTNRKSSAYSVRCVSDLVVEDACKNTYPVVKIGNQYWMAENLKCNKYDTKSEAYNASWLTNNTIPTSESYTYTPYYTDASDKGKWAHDDYGILTYTQVAKLGFLYNWAAAVGVADGTKPFSGTRQGICPNGWHVPTRAEWQTLQEYIEKTEGKGEYTAGKHLKTTSGWYFRHGTDTYGFAALPAGYADGSSVKQVSEKTSFWTVTRYEGRIYVAFMKHIDEDNYLSDIDGDKCYGESVRCVKN